VGPRASLDAEAKEEIPSPHRNSNPDHPIVQPVVSRYTHRAIPALMLPFFLLLSVCFVHTFCLLFFLS